MTSDAGSSDAAGSVEPEHPASTTAAVAAVAMNAREREMRMLCPFGSVRDVLVQGW